jgi:potassium-transporting ATPase KdpC subunit
MLRQLRPAIVMLLVMTAITGFAYPLATTALAGLVFPDQAAASLVTRDGKVIGSVLIGQNFTGASYFHGRPSATTGPDPKDPSKSVADPYNADNSGGSNLGPTSKALIDRVKGDVAAWRKANPGVPVPVDLVTASASGLDPDITPAAALYQVPIVAAARHLPPLRVRALVERMTTGRFLGLLGEPHVNVLKLNLALDALH